MASDMSQQEFTEKKAGCDPFASGPSSLGSAADPFGELNAIDVNKPQSFTAAASNFDDGFGDAFGSSEMSHNSDNVEPATASEFSRSNGFDDQFGS